ncbi:hypothetical protein A3D70_01530 [Candidatus Adlerbacteria bacterium RIFCSPHIGHO2_02_FULL_54_18]|uniref:Cell wall hydrolase SleB domain-containing protein n=1 Tax=Candidatus Adlerbacteria bacterium RIFCSPHIGHO2_02_FULL_54_18 TaxID=1797241 RepID=A0A1F4Y3W5_9BACT|nr:MAG: hypothetical protein A3D70_01530 [Candidatus Adlerbacteria bacterium RIFCSPHIGHO2_02_FULL_54_18]
MMRAKDNKAQWGGATICNVVYHKRFKRKGGVVPEFSWTIKRGTHKPPAHKALWVQAKAAAEDVREGKFIPEGDLQLARFYLRPAHSVRRNVCWFKKNLVFVDIVGKHHFYRLPKNVAEKAILRQSKPPECQPLKRKKNKKKVGAKR